MSELTEIINIVVNGIIILTKEHGLLVAILIFIGVLSILSAIGSKVFQAIKFLFMIFIAIPAVIIVGLLNKENRKERIKELGEIRAHLKENPKKWKTVLYYFLFIFFIFILILVAWWFVKNFILPFKQLNDLSRVALQNYSTNYTKWKKKLWPGISLKKELKLS